MVLLINCQFSSDFRTISLILYFQFHVKGLSQGGSNILQKQETDSLNQSEESNLNLTHGENVHVTIECHNNVGLYMFNHAIPVPVVNKSPESDQAYIRHYPTQFTLYNPYGNTQANEEIIDVSHHGLLNRDDSSHIDHFEMKIGKTDSWTHVGKLDHIRLEEYFSGSEIDVAVRAVNTKGVCSNDVTSVLYVDTRLPSLSGIKITFVNDIVICGFLSTFYH